MFNLKTPFKALQSILQRWEMKREIAAELKYHLELLVEENINSGMSPEEARRSALHSFGNLNDVNEVCLEIRASEVISWFEDFSAAIKRWREKPWFTFLSFLTLSLGIASAIAIFNLINNILWEPISERDSDKIIAIQETNASGDEVDTSNLNFLDLRSNNHSLECVAAYSSGTKTVTSETESIRGNISWISSDFFSVLAVKPFLGRALNLEDHQPVSNAVVMVSYRFWQRQLDSDRNLKDKKINVDGRDYSVVGVLPPEISFPLETDVWIPRELFDDDSARSAHNLKVIARMKDEITLNQIQTDLSSIQHRLVEKYPDANAGQSITAIPLQEHLTAAIRPLLLTFLVSIGLVLCVACANVTNLLSIRDESRQRQIASKIRLGASRFRIFRQVIIECLLLSLLSTLIGLLLSSPIARILLAFISDTIPEIKEIKINGVILIFAGGLSIIIGLLCGLIPSLKLSQLNSADAPIEKNVSDKNQLSGLGGLLVASELALTVILLAGAGLLAQNFWHLSVTNPGFNSDHVLTAQVSLPSNNYQDEQSKINFYRRILEQIKSVPGVQSAGLVNNLPLSGEDINGTFYAEEHPARENYAGFRITSPDYFQSLSIPLLKGRLFAEEDNENSTPVAVISKNLAIQLSPSGNPLGQRIKFTGIDSKSDTWMVIVGIVDDVKHNGLNFPPEPEVYVPYSQRPYRTKNMNLVIKSFGNSDVSIAAIHNEIKSADANLPVKFETMNEIFSNSLAQKRYQTLSLAFFAFFAVVLSITGLFIVMKYLVTARMNNLKKRSSVFQREITIYSVKKGFSLAVSGIAAGLGMIFVISYSMPKLLFGLRVIEPSILIITSTLVLTLAYFTSYLTARRAISQAANS